MTRNWFQLQVCNTWRKWSFRSKARPSFLPLGVKYTSSLYIWNRREVRLVAINSLARYDRQSNWPLEAVSIDATLHNHLISRLQFCVWFVLIFIYLLPFKRFYKCSDCNSNVRGQKAWTIAHSMWSVSTFEKKAAQHLQQISVYGIRVLSLLLSL